MGLETATCGVDPLRSARAAYSKTRATYRVLLTVQNPHQEYKHCVFADDGCGRVVCRKARITHLYTFHQALAAAVSVFVDDVSSCQSRAIRAAYRTATDGSPMVVTAVNGDEVESKADEPWWKF